MMILADALPAQAIFIVGGIGFLVLEVIVILCETVVLRKLQWGSWTRSLLDAALVNMTSGVIGLPLSLINGAAVSRIIPGIVGLALWILLGWLLSVIIEGSMLLLLRRKAWKETILVTLIANTMSYTVLILLFGLLWVSRR